MSSLLRDDREYIVHCDDTGDVIGPIDKSYAHLPGVREQLCHYSTRSMVFNTNTLTYGIQRKNPNNHDSSTRGKWDMGVAGHNCYVQKNNSYTYLDFADNLKKEAAEEIGLDLVMYGDRAAFVDTLATLRSGSIGYICDTFLYNTGGDRERVGLGFIATCEDKITFPDNEVIDFQRLSPDELARFVQTQPDICAPLPLVFHKAEQFRKTLSGA